MLEGNHKVHDGEGFKNLQILRTSSTDRLREIRTKGREGFQQGPDLIDLRRPLEGLFFGKRILDWLFLLALDKSENKKTNCCLLGMFS